MRSTIEQLATLAALATPPVNVQVGDAPAPHVFSDQYLKWEAEKKARKATSRAAKLAKRATQSNEG